MRIKLPDILNVPPKLYPFILDFNKYAMFLLEGGRGSGKTQSAARMILWVCEQRRVLVCAGRVIKDSVKHSVMTVFTELIEKYSLNFEISAEKITHRTSGSTIFFKGFRENESANIKGLEGVDILWIDEAETVTKRVYDIVVPTIRKENSIIIFTMNRYVKTDPVYVNCVKRKDCLHISINYFENPFCTEKLKKEAQLCKEANMTDYNHIWLGQPLAQSSNYLISSDKIENALTLRYEDEKHPKRSILSVDLAGSGADLNILKLFELKSASVWEETRTITWSEKDTDVTKGKIISYFNEYNPDFLIGDGDGLGYSIMVSLKNILKKVVIFRGAAKARKETTGNARADGYLALKEMIESGYLKLNCKNAARQIEYMQVKWSPEKGRTYILDKKAIREKQGESPDYADSVMMAMYGIYYHSHYFVSEFQNTNGYGQIRCADLED